MPTSEKTIAFLVELADILEVDPARVTVDFSFSEIDWDSLAVVSSIALIDEHFDVIVGGQALSDCGGVSDLLALVDDKLGK